MHFQYLIGLEVMLKANKLIWLKKVMLEIMLRNWVSMPTFLKNKQS